MSVSANVLSAVLVGVATLLAGKLYFNGPSNKYWPNLEGKHVIITGGNTGIGLETAVELAKLGATVVIACRASEKTRNAVRTIKERSCTERVTSEPLDLNDLSSVESFCKDYLQSGKPLHLLINNAAVMALPERTVTRDGFEQQFGVNYLAHVLLTERLLPLLKKAGKDGRVVHVSALAHKFGVLGDLSNLNSEKSFGRIVPYATSKLAQIVYSRHLQRRLKGTGVTSNALHPGVVRTEIGRNLVNNPLLRLLRLLTFPMFWYFSKSAWLGAQTTLYVALSPECGSVGG